MKFKCRTLFDITATGVTGHYKSSRIPFADRAGTTIRDETTWNRSRNQQRNWETLTQIIGLRAQLFDVTAPVNVNGVWEFEFAVEIPDAFGTPADPTAVVEADAEGVPMIRDLDNQPAVADVLVTAGPEQNIWFEPLPINIL